MFCPVNTDILLFQGEQKINNFNINDFVMRKSKIAVNLQFPRKRTVVNQSVTTVSMPNPFCS